MPARWVIGVDLGGTKLLAGSVDADLRVHHRVRRVVRGTDRAALLDTVAEAVGEARAAAGGEVEAVGLGIPSIVDARGRSVFSVHLPLEDIPFADVMAERLGVPVFVDNDANLAMLAEHRLGAARGARNAVLLTLGTGIGGGLVLNGELFRGSRGSAAELGHMVVDLDGPPCQGKCPNRGCLEAVASGMALEREAVRVAAERPETALGRAAAGGRGVPGPLVTELAHDGDPGAREVVELIGRRLGAGISGLVNAFDPDVVVIGGGVVAAGELLLRPAREEVLARALPPGRDAVRIVAARFGEESGMLGAAALALDGAASAAAA